MVVYQYGSAVLFNVEDHEVDFYLQAVRRHASGLLKDMRKDGKALLHIFFSSLIRCFYLFLWLNILLSNRHQI